MSGPRLYATVLVALITFVPLAGAATSAQPDPPTIDEHPANPTNETSATFKFSHPDSTATFECQLDGSDFSACTSPQTYPGPLAGGEHTFGVKAIAGPASDPALYTWTIDTTPPPPPTITSGPPNLSATPSATFTFTDDDPSASFQCRIDGGSFATCTSPAQYSLPDGSHTFEVKAIDPAGNESAISSPYPWTIDTTSPPVPTITSGPPNPSGTHSARFTFADDDPSASFQCRLDGGSFASCTSPADYSLPDGPHTFEIKAIDPAGNPSPISPPYSWTIDTVNPVVTLSDKPPALTNQTTASFSFTSNKPASTFECKLDAAVFSKCTSPVVYSGLGDGSHTFAVRATAVTTGLPTTYTWRIDTAAPETTITSGPIPVSNSPSATFTFSSSEAGSTFVCSLDAGGISPCASPTSYAGLGSGAHTFRVQAVDAAGNADATPASHSWQVAGAGPTRADRTPPARVTSVKRTVGYGLLKLVWRRPPDADFDHSNVFVSTRRGAPPRTLVYRGKAGKYTNRRFKNGLYYRYAIVSYDHVGNASREVALVVPPSVLLRSPRNGRVVRKPPRFLWAKVASASFYNIQLYYGAQKVLSAWPNSAKLALTRSWSYEGRRFRLKKGKYRWYVWPAFGPRSRSRYGQLLGQATFTAR